MTELLTAVIFGRFAAVFFLTDRISVHFQSHRIKIRPERNGWKLCDYYYSSQRSEVIVKIAIMIAFLEHLSMSNMLNYTEQVQGQNIKHMHTRHPKQHVFYILYLCYILD